MSISLQKGQKVSLTKDNQGLNQILVGLGWDPVEQKRGFFARKQEEIDCDASVLLLKDGKLAGKEDVVYFGNLSHKSQSIQHMGDNLTGGGDGDDEQIIVKLASIPPEYDRIVIVVNIYQAVQKKQHFGMIKNAFCHVMDGSNNKELCRYNLTESYEGMTAMIFGEVYRNGSEWKFNAIGQGTKDPGLGELTRRYQ